MIIFLYILSIVVSLPLLLLAAKKDFGYITVGGLIPLVTLSLIPIANVPMGIFISARHWTFLSFLSKRIL